MELGTAACALNTACAAGIVAFHREMQSNSPFQRVAFGTVIFFSEPSATPSTSRCALYNSVAKAVERRNAAEARRNILMIMYAARFSRAPALLTAYAKARWI